MKKVFLFLFLLGAFGAFPNSAWAGNNFKDQVPPELNPRQWLNTEALTWAKLKNKVVFLEFFSVG